VRSRIGTVATAAALSVVLSAAGHAVAAGHSVPTSSMPRLAVLAAVAFLLAMSGTGIFLLIPALAAIQITLHVGLDVPAPTPVVVAHHAHHGEALPSTATTSSGPGLMLAMHIGALLISVLLLHRAQQSCHRIGSALARVIPVLPEAPRLHVGVPEPVAGDVRPTPFAQRWLPADVRRRGPPPVAAFPVPS
jgi:hypothetical protein